MMPKVHIGDIDVSYRESGQGAPVVFVHGLGEDKSSWDTQLNDITGFRTVAYDVRGHGETSLGSGEGTLAQLGRDLLGFLAEVTGTATVVGFSLGGTIALWAAAESPDLVQQAIVLGTSTVVGRSAVSYYETRLESAQDTRSEKFAEAMREDTRLALSRRVASLDALVAARLTAVGSGGGYRNAATAMIGVNATPLTPRLTDIHMRVDVVAAECDRFCPAKASQIIVDALQDVWFWQIDRAGHLMNIDDPPAVTHVITKALNHT